jgi:UV DNA damage endonuclease
VHPSQFCVLASPNGGAVQNTIRELVQAARIFDEMGLPRSPFAKINIHVGGVYGDKAGTLDRFCRVVETLPDSVRSRLTVENDDRPGGYTVPDLYESVYRRIGLPVVLDTLHHQLNPGVPLDEAVSMARSTWGDVTPIVHLASSRDGSRAHADWIIDSDLAMIPEGCDVMVEAKATEIAALDVLSRLSDQHSD